MIPNNLPLNIGFIDLNSVSSRLKGLRERSGFSLEYVSNILMEKYNLKLSASVIWKYENYQIKKLNINTISALSKIYNVTQKYILYGDTSMDINTSEEISNKKIEIIKHLFDINDIDALRNIENMVLNTKQISGYDENNY